jgi:hypothetical protein
MGGIVIVVVAGIGITAYKLSQPKKGTIEWHKKEYLSAFKQPWTKQAQNLWNRVRGKPQSVSYTLGQFARAEGHQRALITLGYLEEREFVISNRTINDVIHESSRIILADPRWRRASPDFVENRVDGSNVLVTVARREDMPIFVDAVRKADVP